jgi:hypothetical protein
MPNWTNNEVTLRHKDPAMIERAVKAYQEGKFLNEFIPMPQELLEGTGDGWYGWAVSKWGTKWDVGGRNEFIEQTDANTIELRFDSAWSPPIEGFNRLVEQGFEIEAFYNEFGMAFAGSYTGAGEEVYDDCIEYGGWSPAQIREELPDLDQRFGISECLEEIQAENKE